MAAAHLASDDLYRVLDVPRAATAEEIKAAYRKQVLLHHPDRAAANSSTPNANVIVDDEQIQKINDAYATLSDASARVKYDVARFGSSQNPELDPSKVPGVANYRAMTADDVDQMFSGLNTYERFTTAQYHRQRSARAPAAIRGRATGFQERKQFRASRLPTQGASVAWLAFPLVAAALWAFNLRTAQHKGRNKTHDARR